MAKKKKGKNKDYSQQIIDFVQSIHYLYEKKLDSAMLELGLSNEQFNVLQIVQGQSDLACSLKSIQNELANKTSNTTRLVNKLHSKKLLTKKVNPKDKRLLQISLTPAGSVLLDKAVTISDATNKWLKKSLKDKNDKALLKDLKTIKKGLE